MKKLPMLTAAAMATGAALLVAPDAQACESCESTYAGSTCWSGASRGFGACYVDEEFDECGQLVETYCMVYYDPWCDYQSGWGWDGPMSIDDWYCWSWGGENCYHSRWTAE